MADPTPPPFDPQKVFGELVKLLRQIDPGVESAKVVYRGAGKGVLPVPLDAAAEEAEPDDDGPAPVPLADMDPAAAVLCVLAGLRPGEWMPGKELAGKIGLTHGGGRFSRLLATLKAEEKILSKQGGYRLVSQGGAS